MKLGVRYVASGQHCCIAGAIHTTAEPMLATIVLIAVVIGSVGPVSKVWRNIGVRVRLCDEQRVLY